MKSAVVLQNKKGQKYFFDMHIFDEEDGAGTAGKEDAPPEPVYSRKDLEKAKTQAFEEGKQAGIREIQSAQERKIADILQDISQSLDRLIEAEHEREYRFERESIALSLAVFKQAFPLYDQHHGFEELKEALENTLKTQRNASEIIIEASAEIAGKLEKTLDKTARAGADKLYTVRQNKSLSDHAFSVSWPHGGALYDKAAMARKIEELISQALAENPANGHDGGQDAQPANEKEPDKG